MTTMEQAEVKQWGSQGAFHKVPAETYHALEAASKSRLWVMAPPRTPAHLKYILDHGQEEKDCWRIGDAEHAIALEPSRFQAEYVVSTTCSAKLTTGKNKGQQCSYDGKNLVAGKWYCRGHTEDGAVCDTSQVPVSAEEFESLKAMRNSIRDHAIARELINSAGHTELSLVWRDRDEDALCKCRFDRLVKWRGAFVVPDLKTVRAGMGHPDNFSRQMYNLGYHVQAAIYLSGLSHVYGVKADEAKFMFVTVETTPPYLVVVHEIDRHALARGWDVYQSLLHIYVECQRSNVWPGIPDIQPLALPKWADREEEDGVS